MVMKKYFSNAFFYVSLPRPSTYLSFTQNENTHQASYNFLVFIPMKTCKYEL